MKRLLATATLAVATLGFVPPAAAEPFGDCTPGRLDYLCWTSGCHPEWGCQFVLCLVWDGDSCL